MINTGAKIHGHPFVSKSKLWQMKDITFTAFSLAQTVLLHLNTYMKSKLLVLDFLTFLQGNGFCNVNDKQEQQQKGKRFTCLT